MDESKWRVGTDGKLVDAVDRIDRSAGLQAPSASRSTAGNGRESSSGCLVSWFVWLRFALCGCSRRRCCWCCGAPGPSFDLGCGDCRLLRTLLCLGHAVPAAQADEDTLMHSWWASSGLGLGRYRVGGAALGMRETMSSSSSGLRGAAGSGVMSEVVGFLDAVAPCLSGPTVEMLVGPRYRACCGGPRRRASSSGSTGISKQLLAGATAWDGNEVLLVCYAVLGLSGSLAGAWYTFAEADLDQGAHDFVE